MKKRKFQIERTEEMQKTHFRTKLLIGFFVITFGFLVLLKQIGIKFPSVFISWEMILIMVGFVLLIKHNFKKIFGYVLIILGILFMIHDFYPYNIQTRFIWPILIILFGFSIFIKALKKGGKKSNFTILNEEVSQTADSDDFISSTAFFGGVTKNIVSKNFKGANIMTIFGGTEINLSHANIEKQVIIDITTVFGGINIIVPSNWKVRSEVTSVFGGIDDKRKMSIVQEDENKFLILKGNCVFGGVEISSYYV